MIDPHRTLVASGLFLLLAACESNYELSMYRPAARQLDPPALARIFEERAGVRLRDVVPDAASGPIEALLERNADLAMVENSSQFREGLRAVLPIYQSVLHILVRDNYRPSSDVQPIKGARIYLGQDTEASRNLFEVIARRQRLAPEELQIQDTFVAGETDLLLHFGPVDPAGPTWVQPGYSLVSFNASLGKGPEFKSDGVGLIIPNMSSMTIPALTYDYPGNEEPIVTVAVDMLLATHRDVPEEIIYNVTRVLLEEKQRFTGVAPHMFQAVNESFDPLSLTFPLHAGARRYLERDEPGLLERYAESINLLLYLSFLVLTGVFGFARWRSQRKKDRIDTFYLRAFDVWDKAGQDSDSHLLHELDLLEREAFASLVAEKLAADESFRIFTDLLKQIREKLGKRLADDNGQVEG